ncbi:MAG TPA: hypothetical protein VFP17_03545 [Solirubrobacterales bacterium]|nr:hypothetical protein [Solirubrobacterales bacterium]
MFRAVSQTLATDLRFRAGFLLLGVALSIPIGLISGSLGAAVVVVSIFSILVGLAKYREERSLSS